MDRVIEELLARRETAASQGRRAYREAEAKTREGDSARALMIEIDAALDRLGWMPRERQETWKDVAPLPEPRTVLREHVVD